VYSHPAHFFIKYLLIAPQKDVSNEAVNAMLAVHGMGAAKESVIDRLRADTQIPDDFRPWDKAHRQTTAWLRKEQMFSLFHPDDAVLNMRKNILEMPRWRADVESLILGSVPPLEASYRLRKLNKPISEQAFCEYKHYFWNSEVMSLSDWASYFGDDTSERTRATSTALNAALTGGAELALYRIGVQKELDSKSIMFEVQRELYFTFKEVKTLPLSPKKVEMLSTLARGIARIDERLQAGDAALHEVLKKFEKFKVITAGKAVPALIDLVPTGSVSKRSREDILMSAKG